MPAEIATDGDDVIASGGEQIGKNESENCGFSGMAAGITEAFLEFAGGQAWVDGERSRALPMQLGIVGDNSSLLLQTLEKGISLGKLAGLKELPNRGRKIENGELFLRESDSGFVCPAGLAHGSDRLQVSILLG